MFDCTQDDHRGALRAASTALLAQFGKLTTALPEVRRTLRINNIGFTLPTHATAVLPLYPDDIYIGRLVHEGVTSVSDMLLYRRELIGGVEHFLYVDTRDLDSWLSNQISNHYNYVSSCRNYHALWFRSAVEEYKSTHSTWRADLPQVRSDLSELYRSHIHLGRQMRIPRFVIELENLKEFWSTTGLYVPSPHYQGIGHYA